MLIFSPRRRTLQTLCKIWSLRWTDEMHSVKVDWKRIQKTRPEKLGIWESWWRNLWALKKYIKSISLVNENYQVEVINWLYLCKCVCSDPHCSGLSRGLLPSLSFEDLMCFSIFSSSSRWALWNHKTAFQHNQTIISQRKNTDASGQWADNKTVRNADVCATRVRLHSDG